MIGDEQSAFKTDRSYVGTVFAGLKKRVNKIVKCIFVLQILGKACDPVNREALRQVLRMHGVDMKLLEGIKSFNVGSRKRIKINSKLRNWSDNKGSERQENLMSL